MNFTLNHRLIDACTNGRTKGRRDGGTDGWRDGGTGGRTEGQRDGGTDRGTEGRTDGRTDGKKGKAAEGLAVSQRSFAEEKCLPSTERHNNQLRDH